MFLGIDIGSSSSKALLLSMDGEILASSVVNIGTGTDGAHRVVTQIYQEAGISKEDILFSIVTGYGRMTYTDADMQVTEISCHAKGVAYTDPTARSVIDIGGQDAKVIRLGSDGRVENFVMNEKCSAGTGRCFEVMARVFNCTIQEMSDMANRATGSVMISSTCTVFAESEVISQFAAGTPRESIAKGINQSVAKRVAGLSSRVGLKDTIVMTGGVALISSIVKSLEEELGVTIRVPEKPQVVGALGAAILAREKYFKAKRKTEKKGT